MIFEIDVCNLSDKIGASLLSIYRAYLPGRVSIM